jgi:hypothetical protein
MKKRLIGFATALIAAPVLVLMTGCAPDNAAPATQASDKPAQAGGQASPAPGGAQVPGVPGGSSKGQVVVSGAVKGTFPVKNAWAANFPGDYRVQQDLEFLCSVFFGIPHDTQPGTYPVANKITAQSPHLVYTAAYADGCHQNSDEYASTSGTMTLTSTGARWSGTYKFTGQNAKDASKTVEVSGSFSDIATK